MLLTPTSPVGQGVYRIEGYRVFDASAVHPFAVGFYDCSESGIETVSVFVGRRGGHFKGEIAADVPIATDCGP